LFRAARANYGKFSQRSNRFHKKNKIPARQKTLRTAHNFGFIPFVPIQPPASASVANRRLNIFYSGRVQGVGFRYTVKTVAAGFAIAGCVRNLPDSRVELIAEGARRELEAFREAILGAGLAGFIRDEEVTWADAKNEFRGFEISS
jgi:acylphosphatase